MKIIRILCRLIIGLTFIFSGFVKLVSPVGTGLIVGEYFKMFHLTFLDPLAIYLGMFLSVLEFVIGTSVLIGYKLKLFVKIGFWLTACFTLITLISAITGKMADCGCFGEAVHLTSWQTFWKNVILMACYTALLLQSRRFVPAGHPFVEWGYMGLFIALSFYIALYSVFYVPFVEFTAYKIGADIEESNNQQIEYETVFIYEKDGVKEEFSLEALPDSTWTFVDAVTAGGENTQDLTDFRVFDQDGEDFTEDILGTDKVILLNIYNGSRIDDNEWKIIEDFGNRAANSGFRFAMVSLPGDEDVPDILPEYRLYGDKKMLMTLNRSNGGATYMNNGVITDKWARLNLADVDTDEVYNADNDVLIVQNTILQRQMLVFSIAVLIGIMLIMRYFSNAFYIRKKRNKKNPEKNEK